MNSEIMSKKRPVDILIYKNWKKWFQLIELYFAGEELDFVLYQTEKEYCSTQESSLEKQRQYRRASAKVLYTISICIDTLDKDFILEFATVKEK
jgi:hypothetical protein